MAFLAAVILGASGIQNAASQSIDEADKISLCESKHREFLQIGTQNFPPDTHTLNSSTVHQCSSILPGTM